MPGNLALESDPLASEAVRILLQLAQPKRVWLFGSRARGEHKVSSDYDFALENSQLPMQDRSKISEALESLPTLRNFDVVWLEFASDLLKEEVAREGICLYERQTHHSSSTLETGLRRLSEVLAKPLDDRIVIDAAIQRFETQFSNS